MDAAHIAACSFDAWYPSFRDVTFDSAVLPLPPDLTDFLVQDGVFLPSSSAAVCSLYARHAQLCDAVQRLILVLDFSKHELDDRHLSGGCHVHADSCVAGGSCQRGARWTSMPLRAWTTPTGRQTRRMTKRLPVQNR
jgi:D123